MKLIFSFALIFFATPSARAEKKLVILGDSITEGYGVALEQAFPALIETKIKAAKLDWRVINAGVGGSTSASAPSRMEWQLKQKPDFVILALGANDALRGLNVLEMERNLQKTIAVAKSGKVKIALAGMRAPPNLGEAYTKSFAAVFPRLARTEKITLIPFFIEQVAGLKELNQADGIHPNEKGHAIIANQIFTAIWKQL